MKRIAPVFVLFILAGALTVGCKIEVKPASAASSEAPEDETGTTAEEDSSEPDSTSKFSREQSPSGEILSDAASVEAGIGGRLAASVIDTFESGNYHLKYSARMAEGDGAEEAEVLMDIFMTEGMSAYDVEYTEARFRMIFKDGKLYTISDKEESVTVIDSDSTWSPDGNSAVNVEGLTFVKDGTEEFLGRNLVFEEYSSSAETVRFYFDGSALAGIRTTDDSEGVVELEVLALDNDIPAGVFDIPEGYALNEY